ncbi:MAG: glycosyltransferase family protein [Chitinophagaceae bacterium]|nr:glycosyltransferase family protein [Chitinophagaceae bacterium]
MKILYAVQATGNGHISRAMELLPHLSQKGEVDIFLSGSNSTLAIDAPVKFRSQGLSLFYKCDGGLDYWKMTRAYSPLRLKKEINELPVEKYDLVLNDFDHITSAACAKKGVPSVNFGHQASFVSEKTPRPSIKSRIGEWILLNYAKATRQAGLHFERYDEFIFTPVIKQMILDAQPTDGGYVTVYLPAYCEPQLKSLFNKLPDFRFEIFSRETKSDRTEGHITWKPVNKQLFNESLIHCTGIITGGGFETPAEALHLGKKILSIPIRGQYEQQCNAAALRKMGITTLERLDELFPEEFYNWIYCKKALKKDYSRSVPDLLQYVFG